MIFSKIDDFSQKIQLEQVCRHWRQNASLDWKITKTCPKPLNDRIILGLVLNRCGEWLEELWLQYMQIDGNLIKQMANQMKQLKHLKLSKCHCPTVDYYTWTLPNNLKSFSLTEFRHDSLNQRLLSIIARDCKNLKVLHLEISFPTTTMLWTIGNIKSLVYLSLDSDTIQNEAASALKNVICRDLPNLKALNIGGDCSEMSSICRDCSDLVHLNVYVRHPFQIPDSLNSLTLRFHWSVLFFDFDQFLLELLFSQQNKSIQHLDIRSSILPSSSEFIEQLLGQFPDLKSLHCKKPDTNDDLTSFFSLFQKHLENGRKITIYFHYFDIEDYASYYDCHYHKYILPDDLPQFNNGWRPNMNSGKCENLVLKKLIKEAIDGGNEPRLFLDDWCMK